MSFSPLKKARFYEGVVEQVRHLVESGGLRPGDKLPAERQLASELNISRASVREAISAMEFAGLVEIRHGVGVFLVEDEPAKILQAIDRVLDRREGQLVELLELRQAVESEAAYLAAWRAEETDKAAVKRAYADLEVAVEEEQVGAEEDYRFHMAVVAASGNDMLGEVIELISGRFRDGLAKSREDSLSVPERSRAVLEEHVDIMQAIESGDPDAARGAMWRHLENVRSRYL